MEYYIGKCSSCHHTWRYVGLKMGNITPLCPRCKCGVTTSDLDMESPAAKELNASLANLLAFSPPIARAVQLREVFKQVLKQWGFKKPDALDVLNPHLDIQRAVQRIVSLAKENGVETTSEEVLTLWIVELYTDSV